MSAAEHTWRLKSQLKTVLQRDSSVYPTETDWNAPPSSLWLVVAAASAWTK